MSFMKNITDRARGKNRKLALVVIAGIILGTVIIMYGGEQSVIKNTAVVSISSPASGSTMTKGTLTVSARFYPASAPSGFWPVARAWRILVERVTSANLFASESRTTVFDEIKTVVESKVTFPIDRSVPITSTGKHVVTVYLLVYDSYIDYLKSGATSPPPVGPYETQHLPFSLLNPSTGEKIYYNSVDITVKTTVTVTTTTTTEPVSGFELLPLLLAIPIIIKLIKKREDE